MIGFLKKRKLHRQLKEYLSAARHARHMREDIAEPKDLASLNAAEDVVREIQRTGKGDIEKAVEILAAATDKIYPLANRSGVRENVEVIIVALAAAMAIRAFFFQPFKIPTGSMQPTLNGITTEAQAAPTFMDHQPLKFFKWLATGESYKEVRAKASGRIIPYRFDNGRLSKIADAPGDKVKINIGGTEQKFPRYMADLLVLESDYINEGDILARGRVIAGDHILVNKMKYNFMKPERGDIAVFDTRHLHGVRGDSFYIKRMCGLPGEKMQIQNGHLVADGKIIDDPPIFKKIDTDPAYSGHTNDGLLNTPEKFIQLGDQEYLMCGDNTRNSLDGRFFGGVERSYFQGPAMFVYWPFREHWGLVH